VAAGICYLLSAILDEPKASPAYGGISRLVACSAAGRSPAPGLDRVVPAHQIGADHPAFVSEIAREELALASPRQKVELANETKFGSVRQYGYSTL
jgi:hypothetical protein